MKTNISRAQMLTPDPIWSLTDNNTNTPSSRSDLRNKLICLQSDLPQRLMLPVPFHYLLLYSKFNTVATAGNGRWITSLVQTIFSNKRWQFLRTLIIYSSLLVDMFYLSIINNRIIFKYSVGSSFWVDNTVNAAVSFE